MRSRSLLPLLLIAVACDRSPQITAPRRALPPTGPLRALTPPTVAVSTPSPAGLVACWSADGNARDVVGGNTGAAFGAVSFVPGKFGQALSFDALGGDVQIPASPSLDVGRGGAPTFAAWIFPEGTSFGDAPGAGPIIEFEDGAQLWQHFQHGDDNGLFTNLAATNTTWHILQQSRVVPWNTWSHVAVTYSQATQHTTLWVNGVVVDVTASLASGATVWTAYRSWRDGAALDPLLPSLAGLATLQALNQYPYSAPNYYADVAPLAILCAAAVATRRWIAAHYPNAERVDSLEMRWR